MAFADEQAYEEMINALRNTKRQLEVHCGVLAQAGKDCVDNTDNDPAAERANARVGECVSKIQQNLETLDSLAAALSEELEDIRQAAARANNI